MYSLAYDRRIERDLSRIPAQQRRVILRRIEQLAADSRGRQVEKLSGMEGYRLRIGDYRVLFTIDDRRKRVIIYRIVHRREAYR